MSNRTMITSRLFKVAEPNRWEATYVERSIYFEPGQGYLMEISAKNVFFKQEDGYSLRSDVYDYKRRPSELNLIESGGRYSQKKADAILQDFTTSLGLAYVRSFCERNGLTLVDNPDEIIANPPSGHLQWRNGKYVRYSSLDTKDKEYSLNFRGQAITGIKESDLPRSMRANRLGVHEGIPVGGMTLMRTRDRKTRTRGWKR